MEKKIVSMCTVIWQFRLFLSRHATIFVVVFADWRYKLKWMWQALLYLAKLSKKIKRSFGARIKGRVHSVERVFPELRFVNNLIRPRIPSLSVPGTHWKFPVYKFNVKGHLTTRNGKYVNSCNENVHRQLAFSYSGPQSMYEFIDALLVVDWGND